MSAVFPPPAVKVYSVGELTRAIKGLLEDAYTPVWVEGEVSNLARPSSMRTWWPGVIWASKPAGASTTGRGKTLPRSGPGGTCSYWSF